MNSFNCLSAYAASREASASFSSNFLKFEYAYIPVDGGGGSLIAVLPS